MAASDMLDTMERPATRRAEDAAYGLWAPAVTPLDDALLPDAERFIAHAKGLLADGCHGIGIYGTTGEATSFSIGEKEALLEKTLAAGIPPEQLMVGTGCAALSDTLQLTKRALALDCTKVLMLPPFYYKGVSDDGLYASYAEVIERIGDPKLRIYLYHFPRLSMVPITHKVIERLIAAFPGTIAGLKDSSGDGESLQAYLNAFPQLAIFPGTETLMLAGLQNGGAGCITASANVNAPALRRLYDAWRAGDAEVATLQEQITAVRQVLQANPMIPTLKRILADQAGDVGWRRVRPPLTQLPDDVAAALQSKLAAVGFGAGA